MGAREGARRLGVIGRSGQRVAQPQPVDQRGDAKRRRTCTRPPDERHKAVDEIAGKPAVIDAQDALERGRAPGIAVKRHPGAEHLIGELLIAERSVDNGVEPVLRRRRGTHARHGIAAQRLEQVLHGGEQQVVLVGEVAIDRLLGN